MTRVCADVQARLIDFVDGRIDADGEAFLAAHVEACASCRQSADLWRAAVPSMRASVPAPPSDLAARRLEVDVLRQVDSMNVRTVAPFQRRSRVGLAAVVGLSFAGFAVAVMGVWALHARRTGSGSGPYATVMRTEGESTAGGRPLTAAAGLEAGTQIEVAVGGEAELLMDRGSVLRLFGPARLILDGSPHQVALRLEEGTVQADVVHRVPGETFAVITGDLRVDVKGTRFMVGTRPPPNGRPGSWVRVQEGLVAVRFADGHRRLVGEGEMASAGDPGEGAPSVPAAELNAVSGGGEARTPPAVSVSLNSSSSVATSPLSAGDCAGAVRACLGTARRARENMRAGQHDRALRLMANAGGRGAREVPVGCGREAAACEDDLRYLRAEALRGAGRIDDAVTAFQSLNRPGAPAAMRQNALYAAAELERRSGRWSDALADYERALNAAARGALQEEALVGAMQAAALLGEERRAGTLAHRYLSEFPAGRASVAARRLAGAADGEFRR